MHETKPLWGSKQFTGVDALIDFAKVKLMGGKGAWHLCDKETTALALMSSRFSLRVTPQV